MKKTVFVVLLLLASLSLFGINRVFAENTQSPLQLIDGYFQINNDQPIHLLHGEVETQSVWGGNQFTFWMTFKLKDGAISPCGRKDDKPCDLFIEVSGMNDNNPMKTEASRINFRMDGDVSFSVMGNISRKFDAGKGEIHFVIAKDNVEILVYKIPIEIH